MAERERETKSPLVLQGDLTIRRIAEVRARMAKALEGGGSLEIEFAEVTDTDLTLFQLLCSAHRTAALRREGQIVFRGALPESLRRMGSEAGPCRECAQRKLSCYWEAT